MGTRAEALAKEFESAQASFTELVESLTDEQWLKVGANYPQRLNEEDERRTLGVIAHHVAINGPFIMDRTAAAVAGQPWSRPSNFAELNARHAEEHHDVTRSEVLRVLRETRPIVAAAIRAIPDEKLDEPVASGAGPMSASQRIERVLIGHLKMHQGSIEAALGSEDP